MKPDQISWEEEHEAFKKRSREVQIGDNWTLGIYQDIPDDSLPQTRLKDNSLHEFLVPEQHLSLKLFFDNLRNYGICAAFAALGAWLWLLRGGGLKAVQIPLWVPSTLAIACWLLVACLLILNVCQTWMLSSELFRSIRRIHISHIRVYGPSKRPLHSALVFGHIVVSLLADWLVLLAVQLFAITLVVLCIGFVVYAILASPGVRGAA